jgi:isopentenyl phosphate kinase
MQGLVFLKLGGSLITDKSSPRTALRDLMRRIAGEIVAAREVNPGLSLLLGHGSGSFGHIPARKYNTRQGVQTAQEWQGFAEVWKEAATLNHFVMDSLHAAGLPAIALPASASLTATNRQVYEWNLYPCQSALRAGLIPVVYGDVIFDRQLGGTIYSTEDLFVYLADQLRPQLILLAGIEDGVWLDFPARNQRVEFISPGNLDQVESALGGSAGADVTGGMASKVKEMVRLAQWVPGLKIRIFSGKEPGSVQRALAGEDIGTRISAAE